MSLESAYMLGEESKNIVEKLRIKEWDKYPIVLLRIEKIDGAFKFAGMEEKSPGTVEVLPTPIGGPKIPYLPSLVAKAKLRFGGRDDDGKKQDRLEEFKGEITKKIDKLNMSAEKMKSNKSEPICEFGWAVTNAFESDECREAIAKSITMWAEKTATRSPSGVNGVMLDISVTGKHPLNITNINSYLMECDRKMGTEHSGKKVKGEGRCAWCHKIGEVRSRMDYWAPGNVDNLFSAPYGRKEDTYKVIPICPECHDRLNSGMKILKEKYRSSIGGGIYVLFAPRILYGNVRKDLRDEVQEFWKQLRGEILELLQVGVQQLSCRGEKVLSLRGVSTSVSDLADVLEGECLTFDVTWLRKEQASETILTRAYDVVPTWLLRLAEITDFVNDKRQNAKWSFFSGLSDKKFTLEGKHFWPLFPQPGKQKEARIRKARIKPPKTMTFPWVVASEVLGKRLRPFHEYLPDFFVGVDAYWCSAEENERKKVFGRTGAEMTKIVEWLSLWHKFSIYSHLIRKEMGIMDQMIENQSTEEKAGHVLGNSDTRESGGKDSYSKKVIDAAIQEVEEARVYRSRTEKGVFLAGIALGMLAVYQDQDDKTMRVLDYAGDYRLGEIGYKDFALRFGDKLREYLYVKDFKDKKGDIVLGLMSASVARTAGGFESLTPEEIGFALLSGVLRAGYYFYMPGGKTTQKEGGKI